ncbi:MAG: hypothetical protein ABII20_04080 [Candidatus Omnitrophota bacterium]|nr:hypothetical protein [Candidatus Omnitrophota bacterium]MBU2528440.1 hypothetical protein [bacterium]MBU3930771.1 hypothetical protein [bacterium]MBU4123295.1 hypothetical protein [bacterium]
MKNLMNWTAAGMMMATLAAFSPLMAETPDKSEMAEFREWKQKKAQNLQKRDERRKAMHEKRMERMTKELGLSEKQKTSISGILENSWKKVAEERNAFTDKVKKIRETSDKGIEKELTKEQIKKWEEHKSRMMKQDRKMSKKGKKMSGKKGDRGNMRGSGMDCESYDCGDGKMRGEQDDK